MIWKNANNVKIKEEKKLSSACCKVHLKTGEAENWFFEGVQSSGVIRQLI